MKVAAVGFGKIGKSISLELAQHNCDTIVVTN
jgi:hypothetical protein